MRLNNNSVWFSSVRSYFPCPPIYSFSSPPLSFFTVLSSSIIYFFLLLPLFPPPAIPSSPSSPRFIFQFPNFLSFIFHLIAAGRIGDQFSSPLVSPCPVSSRLLALSPQILKVVTFTTFNHSRWQSFCLASCSEGLSQKHFNITPGFQHMK